MNPAGCGGESCREMFAEAVEKLRGEFNEKHSENKAEIHELRDGQNDLKADLHILRGRIEPYLDNGQPGLFSKMSTKLDTVLTEIGNLKVAHGEDKGRRDVYAWIRAAIAPLIVGILLLFAQHAWK